MEVLLMTDVADLGSEGQIVQVADGYARNYLLPKKLAAAVNEATRRRLAKMQRERDIARTKERDAARAMAARLEGVSCTIAVKTAEDGKLYGSVGANDIAGLLKEQGIEIDRHTLELDKPIKELGVYNVKVNLHPDVGAAVKVWIVEE